MAEGIDMSLDDIIKNNKKSAKTDTNTRYRGGGGGGAGRAGGGGGGRSNGRGGVRGFESGSGPNRRLDNRFTPRMNPYFVPQAVHMREMLVGEESKSESETKLYVSNLDEGVTNEDIKVLFSDVGELKRYSVHYDRTGRSKGTAEVVYMRQSDAVAAMKRYNSLQLDGKPMKLELVGLNIVAPVPMPSVQKGILGNSTDPSPRIVGRGHFDRMGGRIVGRGQKRGGAGGFGGGGFGGGGGGGGFGGGGGGRNRGNGRNGGPPKHLSAEELDADLEKYRLAAMRIK